MISENSQKSVFHGYREIANTSFFFKCSYPLKIKYPITHKNDRGIRKCFWKLHVIFNSEYFFSQSEVTLKNFPTVWGQSK